MPIDIFDTETSAQDRIFRYPLYERFLWLMVVVAGVVALVFLKQVRDFIQTEGRRAWLVFAVVTFFLLLTVWTSLRACVSKIIISPVSLKARVFGQGVQRISWVHIRQVLYKWRPFGHKLVFVGSDGARVTFRSSINGYSQLIAFIREICPEHVTDQLDELLGEEEFDDDDDTEPEEPEADAEGEPDEKPADDKATQQPPPSPEDDDADSDEEESDDDEDEDEEDDDEEEGDDEGRKRRRWWPFGR